MNSFQKLIKYCAMAIAVLLIIVIFSSIAMVIGGIVTNGSIHIGSDNAKHIISFGGSASNEYIDVTKEFEGIKSLEINNSSGKLTIKKGESFKVEAKDVTDDFIAEVDDDTLYVNDKGTNSFFNFTFDFFSDRNSEIIITLPEGFIAEKAIFDNGSGSFDIEELSTKSLEIENGSGHFRGNDIISEGAYLDFGSGSTEINHFDVGQLEISSGSGAVAISDMNGNDLDLDSGSGSVSISGSLTGNSNFDTGSGMVAISLDKSIDEYEIDADAGSGGVWINGKKEKDYHRGNITANNSIEINGGSGRVTLNFK